MNKIIKQIFLPLLLILSMGSCNDDPKYFTLETPEDQMALTASTESVVLQRIDDTKDAITFSWSKAADRGSDIKVVYHFRLYHAEMKNLQSELIRLDSETTSITWTVRELNNLLNAWNIAPGNEATIEAEVLAVVETSPQYMKPEVSKIQFNTIGYNPSNKLHLTFENSVGKQNFEMNTLGEGIFNWKGRLDLCDFWFVRDTEKGMPAYMKGESENTLVYSDVAEGNRFTIDALGGYDITVDLNKLEITVVPIVIKNIFLVTSKDGVERVRALDEFEEGTSIFYLQDEFEAGTEFRFAEAEDATWPAYVKGADATKLELKDEGAEMFKVDKTATYVMTVNMMDFSLIFLDVYKSPSGAIAVVGGPVSSGWNAGVAINDCVLTQKDLKNRPEVISYTGNFKYTSSGSNDDNAFKFIGDGGWRNSLFAPESYANPFDVNKQTAEARDQGSRDWKWKLPSGTTSGIYTLEMNLHTMKISLVKQ